MRLKNRLFWFAAVISLILDQLTKHLVVQSLTRGATLPVWQGIFELTHVRNPGAAFSILVGAPWLRWLSLIVSLGLIAFAWFGPKLSLFEQLGWGFVLGGAMGNGIDRFLYTCEWKGKIVTCVVDFLLFPFVKIPVLVDFKYFSFQTFPVFNLADVFINVGIVCLLIASLRHKPPTSNTRHL